LGEVALLAWETVVGMWVAPIRWRLVLSQIAEAGFRSQLVVAITGAFTGAVFAVQTQYQFHKVGLDSAVGSIVSVSMFRELGPVLTGLMVAGRVGASIAAEIGTMKVTEQIDALRALGVQPVDYLVVPRAIAIMISMPLLVAESVGLGVFAGYVVGTKVLGVTEAYYLENMLRYTNGRDIKMALTKGFVFGLIIVFISCREGLNASEGAVGVGKAPTEAVVVCSLFILVINFFLSIALNLLLPYGS
jgi:phospholipid/cholesterol/gamma-HCH transport system permease protein